MKPSIEVIVSSDGTVVIDAMGFSGPDCEQATRFLEAALGIKSQGARKTEYHSQRQVKRHQHQKGGL